jgi:DNA-binding CsgD family transcriptional regulator
MEITPPPVPSPPSSTTGDKLSSTARARRTLLTGREEEVVRLIAEGKSNKEISSVLAISVRTVETYRSRLMLKLHTTSIAHLVQYAVRNRIVTF